MKPEPSVVLIILPIPFLRDQKRNAPPGILYVAGALEQSPYVSSVNIVDLRGVEPDSWLDRMPEADIYGVSATSIEYPMAVFLAHMLKRNRKGIVVLGGVHATVSRMVDDVFDCHVQGEGEEAIERLVRDYMMFDKVSLYTGTQKEDLDSFPLPARHLLPYDSIVSTELVDREKKEPATTIMTSRGCPHDCSFCANQRLWKKKVRFHSVERVVEEIKQVMDTYSVRHFRFHDDTMTMSKKRLRKLSEALSPLGITWRGNGRVGEIDLEAAELMKSCGCVEVGLGIESASQEALDLCRKKVTVRQNAEAIRIIKEAGMRAKIFFIIGLPGDFGDLSGRIIQFIKETEPDAVNISTLAPLPGCDLYEYPKKFGIRLNTRDISKYRFFYGLDGNECDEDFVFDYRGMSNVALKYHRRKILEFVAERGLNKIK